MIMGIIYTGKLTLARNMFRIAVITTDDPKIDPSIKLLSTMQDEFDVKFIIINPYKKLDESIVRSVDIFYPRITGTNIQDIDRQTKFYVNLVKKYGKPYIGNLKFFPHQKDKFFQYKWAVKTGLSVPLTFKYSPFLISRKIAKLGGFPVVLKARKSFGGTDVHLIESMDDFKRKVNKNKKYVIQKYLKNSGFAKDYRVYIVGNKVVGGLIRTSQSKSEFRSNTSLGAIAEFNNPGSGLSNLAKKYVKKFGFEIMCVDFMKSANKYYFVEANDAFSIKTDNEPQKIVVSQSIIKYLKDKGGSERSNRA